MRFEKRDAVIEGDGNGGAVAGVMPVRGFVEGHDFGIVVDFDNEAAEEVVTEDAAEGKAKGFLESSLIEQIDVLIVKLHAGKGEGCTGREAELRKVATTVAGG